MTAKTKYDVTRSTKSLRPEGLTSTLEGGASGPAVSYGIASYQQCRPELAIYAARNTGARWPPNLPNHVMLVVLLSR